MPKPTQARLRKDLAASYDAIKNSFFWQTFIAEVQKNHDAALLIVRSKADGPEPELRTAAALCSAFHTVLSLPQLLTDGSKLIGEIGQEDTEGTEE